MTSLSGLASGATAPLALMAVASTGLAAGLLLARLLAPRSYRIADESDLPRRSLAWVAPVTAVASVLVWWAVAPGRPLVVPVVYVLATWVMVALTAIDLDVHRLPNAIQLPAYPILTALLAACSLATGDWGALLRAVLAGAALFALFLVLALVAPRGGLGYGDVKLAGLLGLLLGWLGWPHVVLGAFGTFLLGGVVGVALLVSRRATRESEFAYGPVMLGSAWATVVVLSRPFFELFI